MPIALACCEQGEIRTANSFHCMAAEVDAPFASTPLCRPCSGAFCSFIQTPVLSVPSRLRSVGIRGLAFVLVLTGWWRYVLGTYSVLHAPPASTRLHYTIPACMDFYHDGASKIVFFFVPFHTGSERGLLRCRRAYPGAGSSSVQPLEFQRLDCPAPVSWNSTV